MITKICTYCKEEKVLDEFYPQKRGLYGKKSKCKICDNLCTKLTRKPLSEETKLYRKEYIKEWSKNNRDKLKTNRNKWLSVNLQKERKRQVEWRRNNKEYCRTYIKDRRKHDSLFKLSLGVKSLIKGSFDRKVAGKYIKAKKTESILGCSFDFFMKYMESKFLDGMTWNNHSRTGWHIDHIIPISSAKTEEDIYKLNHYTNLQPLWAIDNLKKSNKIAA